LPIYQNIIIQVYHLKSYRKYVDSVDGAVVVEETWSNKHPCMDCKCFDGSLIHKLARCAIVGVPCGGQKIGQPAEEPEDYKLTPQDEINNGQQFFSFDRWNPT
jgi:hypothetical protein